MKTPFELRKSCTIGEFHELVRSILVDDRITWRRLVDETGEVGLGMMLLLGVEVGRGIYLGWVLQLLRAENWQPGEDWTPETVLVRRGVEDGPDEDAALLEEVPFGGVS